MKRRFAAATTACLLSLCSSAPSFAQLVDVPTFEAGTPTFTSALQEVDVAPGADGGYVVMWGELGNTLAGNRIATHRFSRSGVEMAPPVRVDSSGYGLYPNITQDVDGGFIGAWMWSHNGSPRALYARRLTSAGVAVGSEFRVDTPDSGPMNTSAVTCRSSGCVYFYKQNGMWIRAYDKFGTPITASIRVDGNTPAFEADIDALPDGSTVVVWSNLFLEDHSWARIYTPAMAPLGPSFLLESTGIVDEVTTSASGQFAVVGRAYFDATTGGEGGARNEIWMRRYNADGTPLGPRSVVHTVATDVQPLADADYDSNGNLLVVWREYDETHGSMAVPHARAYDAAGNALGPAVAISEVRATEIQTTALADDCFANAWYFYGKVYSNVVCLCGSEGCGDGNLDATCEICDDGNSVNGDGCDSNCRPSECGNGIVAPNEGCDDGNDTNGDGCDSNCTATACGNGIVTASEQCDDGNVANDDGCDANCRPSGCGNGSTGAGEECDDGNAVNGDGCDEDCHPSRCGNGIAGGSEQCDDGNAGEGDGCDSDCTTSACGNGIQAGGEECDDDNLVSGDGCDGDCLVEACGNGRREGLEECDGDASCNEDCTLRAQHDSVVLQFRPIEVSIPVGNSPFTRNVEIQVQNADVFPEREIPGHLIRLTASDGNCPPGTVSGQPDFDRGTPGVQDTTMVAGGVPRLAIADVTVSREGFAPFDHRIPQRCTLWFHAEEPSGASDDPTPDNNTIATNLDVTDSGDPTYSGEEEFFVESMDPITIKVPSGQNVVTKQIKPVVRRSRDLPSTVADVEVTVSASDGDCPEGTVGYVDFDRRVSGHQARMMLRRGKRAKGALGLIIRANAFESPSDESPRRCTALITATSAGDTDPSNNTTRLVIDVVDRNDY